MHGSGPYDFTLKGKVGPEEVAYKGEKKGKGNKNLAGGKESLEVRGLWGEKDKGRETCRLQSETGDVVERG